jgi:hypothetical protein
VTFAVARVGLQMSDSSVRIQFLLYRIRGGGRETCSIQERTRSRFVTRVPKVYFEIWSGSKFGFHCQIVKF